MFRDQWETRTQPIAAVNEYIEHFDNYRRQYLASRH